MLVSPVSKPRVFKMYYVTRNTLLIGGFDMPLRGYSTTSVYHFIKFFAIGSAL